jgi:hypothetical protein
MDDLATAYRDAGRLAEAIKLWEEVVPAQKKRLGLDHPETLRSMNKLTDAYRAAGR